MHFPMKIQPIDADSFRDSAIRVDSAKPVLKTRLKRLLRIYEKSPVGAESNGSEFEPSSIGLDKMVQSFIEDNNEKKQLSRNRCNCFNGNNKDSSDDEFDEFDSPSDLADTLKGLVQCGSKSERNLLADTSKIVEKNKGCKRKDDLRQIVTVGLGLLGYDASICKSRWEKSTSHPAGEYEYIDVIVEKERVIIDVDFTSEFEIARSTSIYKSILQSLPHIFVGGPDRLHQIISIISEAAKQSLKKKGMHVPPWRKAEYMRAKWLSPHTRVLSNGDKTGVFATIIDNFGNEVGGFATKIEKSGDEVGVHLTKIGKSGEEVGVRATKIDNFGNKVGIFATKTDKSGDKFGVFAMKIDKFGDEADVSAAKTDESMINNIECDDFALVSKEEAASVVVGVGWQPPEIKRKSCESGGAKVVVTGLACLLREKP